MEIDINTFIEQPATLSSINRRKLVSGVGINDAPYTVRPKNKDGLFLLCPYYKIWADMLQRCYFPREPAYFGCSVSDEWLTFTTFKAWMILQDWEGNHLDKDIVSPGNKVYSKETCCFVSPSINYLLIGKVRKRELPMGVYRHKGRYTAACSLNNKKVHLGLHDTVALAEKAYKTYKANKLISVADTLADLRVRAGLYAHAEALLE